MENHGFEEFNEFSRRIRTIEMHVTRLDEQGKVWPKMEATLDTLNTRLIEIEKAVVQLNNIEKLGEIIKDQEKKLDQLEKEQLEFRTQIKTQRKVWASMAAAVGAALGWLATIVGGR